MAYVATGIPPHNFGQVMSLFTEHLELSLNDSVNFRKLTLRDTVTITLRYLRRNYAHAELSAHHQPSPGLDHSPDGNRLKTVPHQRHLRRAQKYSMLRHRRDIATALELEKTIRTTTPENTELPGSAVVFGA